MPGFGLGRVGTKGQVEKLLETTGKLDSISAQLVLRDAYDIDYGIYDHLNDRSRPLALAARFDKEDYHEYGGLYRAIYQYNVNEIYKRWGYTVDQFLALPREIHRLILRITAEDANRATLPTEQQIRQLQQNQNTRKT